MCRLKKLQTVCVITLLALNFGRASNIKFTNLKCTTVDQSMGEFKICFLKAVKRDLVELNAHFALKMEVNNASVLMRFKKRGSSQVIYQYKIDACAFFRNNRRNPMADLFYSAFDLKKYSNLNHTCPYNHDIIVKDCRLNTKILTVLPIPSGEYTIFISVYVKENLSANFDASILVY